MKLNTYKDNDFLNDESDGLNDEFSDFDLNDMGGNYQAPMEKHTDLLKSLTNFDPFLNILVSEWLGKTWDNEQQKFIANPGVSPIMNIKGARWCINQVRTYARDNNILTALDSETYKSIMKDIIDTVYYNIGARAEEFEIHTTGDISLICHQLLHTAMLMLIGTAGENNYKKFFSTTTNRTENVSLQPQKQIQQTNKKQGWLEEWRDRLG